MGHVHYVQCPSFDFDQFQAVRWDVGDPFKREHRPAGRRRRRRRVKNSPEDK